MSGSNLATEALERASRILGERVSRVLGALARLRTLTQRQLGHGLRAPDEVAQWLVQQRFGQDASGFFRPQPAEASAPVEFGWSAERAHDEALRARLCALAELAPELQQLREGLPGVAWLYYMDAGNAALVHPYLGLERNVPSRFDWTGYRPYRIAHPQQNPALTVRWTPPTVDGGGEGLVTTACLPALFPGRGELAGVWALDVPVRWLHGAQDEEQLADEQLVFVVDGDGRLVSHPSLFGAQTPVGTVYDVGLGALGGEFASLTPAQLAQNGGQGERTLRDRNGLPVRCRWQGINGTDWHVLLAVSAHTGVPVRPPALRSARRRQVG
ncbi:hypothetical protein FGE12_06945 [Aggregicoccus sp. 17bor-14]|uniref:cache domain-containing protein n=1 Tax=Myxococcaceae TaxID=31 RepID=UPI00129C80B0|nr:MULTISPECIES: cache domain-containing protein [Myxococcaceae]MBF5042126.1 cache domain-containing protein [Simulacricoccus sp. 17bor-14]MRI87903.1 hypothetical protein [Aggregicoccus sp. 17bor-14]